MPEPSPLSERYTVEDGTIYLSGLQALVRLPLDVARHDRRNGRRTHGFISGYEGSPLAGYDLELARRSALLAEYGIVFRPGLNEELAVNAVQGSQLAGEAPDRKGDGVAGYWYGKAPGLDRASDAMRHANLGGAHPDGGALAIVGDDSTAKSSTVPSSSEIAMAELGLPVLVPANPQEVLELGLHGIMLSRFSGLWAGLKIATNVADGSATTVVSPDRVRPVIPDATVDGSPYRHRVTATFLQPTLAELEHSLFHQRVELARRYAVANGLNRVFGAGDDAKVGVIAAGATYLDVRQALRELGLDDADLAARGIRLLKLGMVHPLDPGEITAFAAGLTEIVVVEEKRPFIETAVKEILYGDPDAPAVSGKRTPAGLPLLRPHGDLTPELIADALRKRLGEHITLPGPTARPRRRRRTPLPVLTTSRTPYFCSGCPHNRSTATPEGSLVGAGIGCSGLVTLMPERRVGTVLGLTQMGGEGGPWLGMAPFVETRHFLQNMGDGTFHHSGSLAIRAAVASGVNITFKILHNSAVAMTGGQRVVGGRTVPELANGLLAEGVARVIITTEDPRRYRGVRLPRGVEVRHRDDLVRAQEELSAVPGVTVLIHDQECATELRRKRKRGTAEAPRARVFINERVCEGCGDCGARSNCLSVQPVPTELGRKTRIHQASCNQDYSCLDGDCPSFLSVVPGGSGARPARSPAASLPADTLPEPSPVVPTDAFETRITGIGGTGVVTVAQILAVAATLGGLHVSALDQTGLAQKGGAVVSDVKISRRPIEQANKITSDRADLYIGCDILVAAAETYLGVAHPERTVAVVSTAEVPTGAMVTDTTVAFPSEESTVGRIRAVTRPDVSRFLDARALTHALFDDDQFANVFLLGVAYQSGALPVAAEHLERAITLNGVAVDRNIQAFRRGRQFVADPDALHAAIAERNPAPPPSPVAPEAVALAATVGAEPGSELAALVERRAGDLIAYQDHHYAARYVGHVARVLAAERAVAPHSTRLTTAVAQHLHKLMAYKDEYEVARLSLDPALTAALAAEFGPGYRARFLLHPPLLRALGMKRKISLGQWFTVVFRLLYGMRRLRHTPLDPFGRTRIRRAERALVAEYLQVIDRLLAGLDASNLDHAVRIAELPDLVRGYEHLKLRNIELYRARTAEELDDYGRRLETAEA